jgi:glycine oxidase
VRSAHRTGPVAPTADVAVVGGGAIGCSVAYHAARRGARVVLLEAERLGAGSSGALAGMLSAQAEAEPPGALLDLMLLGRDSHRALSEELPGETGVDPGYVWAGALKSAVDEASERTLVGVYRSQEEAGLRAVWLTGDEARELEPALSPEVRAGLYLPDDGQVNPPQLVQALARGATLGGAEIRESTRVSGFVVEGQRVTGVRTMLGDVSAHTVVLAGGASSGLLSERLGVALPLYPVKGQMLVANMWPSPVEANVWDASNFYVVPKKDGRVILGATEEPGVHDRRTTLGGVAELSRSAVRLVPKLSEAWFVGTWGGLRPGTPSGRPILGPIEGWEGLLLATGHFRNGVLLSAVTGEIIAALALDEEPPGDVAPFLHEVSPAGMGVFEMT